jgi:hypothetical protein
MTFFSSICLANRCSAAADLYYTPPSTSNKYLKREGEFFVPYSVVELMGIDLSDSNSLLALGLYPVSI